MSLKTIITNLKIQIFMTFISALQIFLSQSYDCQYSYGQHVEIAIIFDMRWISVVP
jgi:hypothetical protein